MVVTHYLHCIACGGPIDDRSNICESMLNLFDFRHEPPEDVELDSAYNEQTLAPKDIEWLSDFRAIGVGVERLLPGSTDNEARGSGYFLSSKAHAPFDTPSANEQQWLEVHDTEANVWRLIEAGTTLHEDGTSDIPAPYPPPYDLAPRTTTDGMAGAQTLVWPIHNACLALMDAVSKARACASSRVTDRPSSVAEFVRAYFLREHHTRDLCSACHPRLRTGVRLCPYWSHHYFGAYADWEDQGWWCVPGEEWYCADPLDLPKSELTRFATSYALPADGSILDLSVGSSGSAKHNKTPCALTDLPIELIDTICRYTSVPDILAMTSTCKSFSSLRGQSWFWHQQTLYRHGDWFWELADGTLFAPRSRWMSLLLAIERTYAATLAAAAKECGLVCSVKASDEEHIQRSLSAVGLDDHGEQRLPLGLRSRLRIWLCIESVGRNGEQLDLYGQTAGLEDQQPGQPCRIHTNGRSQSRWQEAMASLTM